jgi:hypothetical protein
MKCKKIVLSYEKEEGVFPNTTICVEDIPPAELQKIAKQYNKEVVHEGINDFIEFNFGDITLKFRFTIDHKVPG